LTIFVLNLILIICF